MSTARPGAYRERLPCPWSWYLTGSIAGLLLAPEISFVTPIPFWVTGPLGVIAAVVIVAWMGRAQIVVDEAGVLCVRGARLTPQYIGGVAALNAPTTKRLLGREGDPAAFLAVKPWIHTGVQVVLNDPEDPVPYWLVGSRHPDRLAAAIATAARISSGGRP